MTAPRELTDFELDALRETANIGTGNASIALSSLLGQKVSIDLPKTNVVPVRKVAQHIASDQSSMVGIYSKLKTGLVGNILFLLPIDSALMLMSHVRNEERGVKKDRLSKEELEMLRKLGSVVCSAYLTGLAKFFEQKIEFQSPNIISSIGSSIVDFIMVEIGDEEMVLLITVGFNTEKTGVDGTFTLLFTTASLAPLLEKLNAKMGG